MTTFYFRDAELISRLALVGVSGQSRSGKTLTALRVAHGIASVTGGKVAAIDTEAGRMLEYGPGAKPFGFNFKYAQFDPPFTGERYLEILLEAEKIVGAGGVIVIDSMSHEHEGEGGVLEQHEALVGKLGASSNMTAWNKAKEGRKKLINYVRSQRRCHLIMCFRAEQKTGVAPGGKPVDLGIQLIGWQGWKFEMSLFVMLDRERRGVELSHDTTASLDHLLPDGQITEATGEALARWCGSGSKKAPDTAPAQPDTAEKSRSQEPRKSAPSAPQGENSPDSAAAQSDSPDDLATARRLYKAIGAAATLGELGTLEHENADLLARLKDEKAKKSVADLFKKRLAELSAPTAADHALADDLDEDPEWQKRADEINAEHAAHEAQEDLGV